MGVLAIIPLDDDLPRGIIGKIPTYPCASFLQPSVPGAQLQKLMDTDSNVVVARGKGVGVEEA